MILFLQIKKNNLASVFHSIANIGVFSFFSVFFVEENNRKKIALILMEEMKTSENGKEKKENNNNNVHVLCMRKHLMKMFLKHISCCMELNTVSSLAKEKQASFRLRIFFFLLWCAYKVCLCVWVCAYDTNSFSLLMY